jgi:hypothetical protein
MDFPLQRFTRDPHILNYAGPLKDIYRRLIAENDWTFNEMIDQLKELSIEDDDWLLKKIRGWSFSESEILNGLFLKIYDANMATLNWPPLNYPLDAPLLVHVPGYHGESVIEWSMRILHKIGLDMSLGYDPSRQPPSFTPDLSNYPATHIFERAWLSDPNIRDAYTAIRNLLVNPPPAYASKPIHNTKLLRQLLSGPSLEENLGGNVTAIPSNDNDIMMAYCHVGELYEDTICSNMGIPSRFYGPILSSTDFESYYSRFEQRSKELEADFKTNAILPEKLTRKGLAWDQQLFTVIGPSTNPATDRFRVLSRGAMGMAEIPIADTVWIQVATEPYTTESSAGTPCVIQGAFMNSFRPYQALYTSGVLAVSPYLTTLLSERGRRREIADAYHPLPVPDHTIKTDFKPLMSNLRRLRKTFKKRSWHFWGPDPSKLVNEIIQRYGHGDTLLIKNEEIRNAATALQMHHTTANKDALIQALKDAIRRYKGTMSESKTNYRPYNAQIQDLEEEMGKPWYAKTWGKAKTVIKNLLETYLETFSDKGAVDIVNALLELKAMKSQVAIDKLKFLIEERRLKNERASTNETPAAYSQQAPTPVQPSLRPTNVVVPIVSRPGTGNIQVPLSGQNGWSTRLTRKGKPKFDDQRGGWSPSLMASFAVNGMRLLPVAGYMGYKMFKNQRKTRRG